MIKALALAAAIAVSGSATWYDWHAGQAAAGPALRQALGPHWRGKTVRVCAGKCITVKLTDWCACGHGRIIDLDDQSFKALAPLSAGVIPVTVTSASAPAHSATTPKPTPPPTDYVP